jgi:hypothetical protein
MTEPTVDDIDALVGPATPHFAFQLRARVRELIHDLPENDPVRRYGEEKIDLLDRLGYASTKSENAEPESRDRMGWETIPSSATASDPLPRGER